jgi:hypothetical protein
MKTYVLATPLVASLEGKRMIGRVILHVKTDPYSRLILKFRLVIGWTYLIHISKSTPGQWSETINSHPALPKTYEIDHSPHDIYLVRQSGHTAGIVLSRDYRKHFPRSEKNPVRVLPQPGQRRNKPILRRRIRK